MAQYALYNKLLKLMLLDYSVALCMLKALLSDPAIHERMKSDSVHIIDCDDCHGPCQFGNRHGSYVKVFDYTVLERVMYRLMKNVLHSTDVDRLLCMILECTTTTILANICFDDIIDFTKTNPQHTLQEHHVTPEMWVRIMKTVKKPVSHRNKKLDAHRTTKMPRLTELIPRAARSARPPKNETIRTLFDLPVGTKFSSNRIKELEQNKKNKVAGLPNWSTHRWGSHEFIGIEGMMAKFKYSYSNACTWSIYPTNVESYWSISVQDAYRFM